MADDIDVTSVAGVSNPGDSGNAELSVSAAEEPVRKSAQKPVHHEPPHSLGLVAHMWASPPALIQLPADAPAERSADVDVT